MRLLPTERPPLTIRRLAWSALAGLLAGVLLARGAVTLVLALVPGDQPYVRTVVGTFGALLSVIVGFALAGALSTRGLPIPRLGLTRSQARWRSAIAAGSTAGLLILPVGGCWPSPAPITKGRWGRPWGWRS
ncbi:hypothetical protein ACFSC4_07055 [Deinococcus malanensis]|uniref:hypothetical protein n=1 Tax=Deinococcus malanensis TaxID=1706855 RepID=UPI003625BDC0